MAEMMQILVTMTAVLRAELPALRRHEYGKLIALSRTIKQHEKEGDRVFRTYFVNNRGDEAIGTVWSYLDLTPLGRQETWEDSPEGWPQTAPYKWWNWHDNYDAEPQPSRAWVAVSDAGEAAMRARP